MVAPAVTAHLDRQSVMEALATVMDPEIPTVSVVDLGIVQDVTINDGRVTVAITPTFTGCPALEYMRREIRDCVLALGATDVDVPVVLDPPWSTDRISAAGWAAMQRVGIAPPVRSDAAAGPWAGTYLADASLRLIGQEEPPTPPTCPWCGSHDTQMESPFGPTICRSIHYCHACQQSFEEFKAL